METKKQKAKKAELIKELDNLDISIEFTCPNTGEKVSMSSKGRYDSPIRFERDEVEYSEVTTDVWESITIERACTSCGAIHVYNL